MNILKNRRLEVKEIVSYIDAGIPVVLHGKTGVGKTALCNALYNDRGYAVKVLDGSFEFKKEELFIQKRNLFGKKAALLIDNMDRSLKNNYLMIKHELLVAVREEKKIVRYKSRVPIIFICNNIKGFKFGTKFCRRIKIKPLKPAKIEEILRANAPGSVDLERISSIAKDCQGDIRMALNSLETGEITKKPEVNIIKIVRNMFFIEPEFRYEYLEKHGLGESKGISLQWFISLLSRNVEEPIDFELLATASEFKYQIQKRLVVMLISFIEQKKIGYIKYPKRKKVV